ncbi:MAG: glycosyltransferase family 2 protein [Bryobacteraceae bacterium]
MITAEGVDIVVPILNEAGCVDELVDRLTLACPRASLIFVDNGSTDGTLDRLRARGVETIRHDRNEGYGKSLRDGIAHGKGFAVVTIDADLEYPPESIPALLDALQISPVVYGSRFCGGRRPAMGAVRRFGNRFLTGIFNIVCRQRLTDLYTGIKAFRRNQVDGYRFQESGFTFVVEFAAHVSRSCRIAEVPVEYQARFQGRSKMRHVVEALRGIAAVVRYGIRRRPPVEGLN